MFVVQSVEISSIDHLQRFWTHHHLKRAEKNGGVLGFRPSKYLSQPRLRTYRVHATSIGAMFHIVDLDRGVITVVHALLEEKERRWTMEGIVEQPENMVKTVLNTNRPQMNTMRTTSTNEQNKQHQQHEQHEQLSLTADTTRT